MDLGEFLIRDPSLQQISHISLLVDQSSDLPKPCLMSAEDIACTTTSCDLDAFANYDTAHTMITSLLEYEAKLRRAFTKRPQTILWRDRSTDLVPRPRRENASVCSLPAEQPLPAPPQTSHSLSDLLGIASPPPLTIGQFRFCHPLANAPEFNGALSEVVHFTRAAQVEFECGLDYELIPIPSSPLISWKRDRRRLWYNTKNMQATELPALDQPLGAFLRLMWLVLQAIVNEIHTSPPVASFEEVNFIPLLPYPQHEGRWNAVAQNVINVARFFVFALEERARRQGLREASDSDDAIVIETGA
jgi:hypothetical protein